MKTLDIIVDMPQKHYLGKTVSYSSSDVSKIFMGLIDNLDKLNINKADIDYSIAIYLAKLKDKDITKQYYIDNKNMIDNVSHIEEALIGFSKAYQYKNDADSLEEYTYYIVELTKIRNKLLFTVTKQIPELADDLLNYISCFSDYIDYYNDSSKE
ncbi:MAG: hypothetical protein [Caudoviricetes sp.]|nr:MAG: hypothetical protein [Caudoviricetes sp.]